MELIPITDNAMYSPDIVLAAGQTATIHLKDNITPSGVELPELSRAYIQIRSGVQYLNVGELTERQPALVIYSPGTYRIYKPMSANALGVESN